MNLGTKAAVPRFISPSLTRTRAGRHHMLGLTAGVADTGFFGLRVRVEPTQPMLAIRHSSSSTVKLSDPA
jgi:hypothetical protein